MKAVRAICAALFTVFVILPIFIFSSSSILVFGVITLDIKFSFKVIAQMADLICTDTLRFIETGNRNANDA